MKYYKMDTVWQDMNKIKLFKTKSKRFKFLPILAEVESVIHIVMLNQRAFLILQEKTKIIADIH